MSNRAPERVINRVVLAWAVLLLVLSAAASCGVPTLDIPVIYDAGKIGERFYQEYPLIEADVPYVENPEPLQVMDIFKTDSEGLAPVVVFVHGGTWQWTRRNDYGALAETFTKRGFVTVLVDYRVYPEDTYPAFVDDTAWALNWIMQHIDEYGGDPDRVFLLGHSAGSHLIALTLTDDTFRNKLTFDPMKLKGLVLLSGPYHFNIRVGRGIEDAVRGAMGSQENFTKAQPIFYTRGDLPPILMMVGEDDRLAVPSMNIEYYEALKEAGADISLKVLPNNDHYAIVLAMVEGYEGLSLDYTLDFIRERNGG